MRTVYLPLETFDKCKVCNATRVRELRLCSNCGESLYCSTECQKSDWSSHKKNCGKSVKLDLATFYPFLACLAEMCHPHARKPVHPALIHQVLTNVNPDRPPVELEDGSSAKLLVLGDRVSERSMMDPSSTEWWPTAKTLKIASKLRRRIMREGFVLPVCMALCTALVAEMYTTTSGAGSKQKRVRMRYKSTPVSDFGICCGSVDVKSQDKLAYWMRDGDFFKGQDPNDHYWIYFTTMRGEEVILDCAMFTFNFCMMVPTEPYMSSEHAAMFPYAPSFFRDRNIRNNTPALQLHMERHRVSILRNAKVHEAVRSSAEVDAFTVADSKRLCDVMEGIAGRVCAPIERELMMRWLVASCDRIEDCLAHEDWKRFPEEPALVVETDPGEMDDSDDKYKSAEWSKFMRKWKRAYKMKGKFYSQQSGPSAVTLTNRS